MKQGDPVTIVALGDSLTYGWLVSKGYLDYLKEMLENKYHCRLDFVNKGIPGDTAFGGLNRLDKDVLEKRPDTVFIQFALNDAFLGYSALEFEGYIQRIVDIINERTTADIVLITSIYLGYGMEGDVSNIFYNVLDKIAQINKISIVKVHDYWKKHIDNEAYFRTLVQNDFLHPNEEGYKLMAEAIMEIF